MTWLRFPFGGIDRISHIEEGLETVANAGSLSAMKIRGTTVWPLGDSLTTRNGSAVPLAFSDTQYQGWMSMFSNQRLRVIGMSAAQGYTTLDGINLLLPSALASSADIIPVLLGTNDAAGYITNGVTGTFSLSNTTANLATIYQAIIAAGKLPVAITVFPRTGLSANIGLINAWMARYAQANRIPFVDLYSTMVDSSNGALLAAFDSGDGIHQNNLGGKLMGNLIASALAPSTAYWTPYLASANSDPNTIFTNPLLLTDSNADGIPDNWTVTGGGAPSYSLAPLPNLAAGGGALPGTPVTVTFQNEYGQRDMPLITAVNNLTGGASPAIAITTSTKGDANTNAVQTITITGGPTGGSFSLVVTDPLIPGAFTTHPVVGNVYTTAPIPWNASAATVLAALRALSDRLNEGTVEGNAWKITRGSADLLIASPGNVAAVGHTIGVGLRAKAALQGYSGTLIIKTVGTIIGAVQLGLAGTTGSAWGLDFDWTTLYGEWVVPANDANARIQLLLTGNAGASVWLAQPTMIDLTAKGLA